MNYIKKIAILISEDPDVIQEEQVPLDIITRSGQGLSIKVPSWFKAWWNDTSETTKQALRPMLIYPSKRQAIIEKMKEYLSI